jgi:ribosomal-protein-alanine N-acetyltransferase
MNDWSIHYLPLLESIMNTYPSGPETQRLEHRALTLEDADAFFMLNSHPDVMRFTGEPQLKSLAEAKHAIANYPDFKTYGYGRWACVLKKSRDIIGFCGLKYLPELDEVDVGFRFLPEYWGQGLATEACAASITFGFDTLKLDRIIGLVLSENAASIRVLEKCGMIRIGDINFDGEQAMKYEIHQKNV